MTTSLFELIDNPLGRDIEFEQLRKTLNDTNPNNVFFQARLVCINKLKGEEIPTLDDIRPIAITGLMQKLIEKANISKIGDKILSKINKAQCGFVKEKETLLHVSTVAK